MRRLLGVALVFIFLVDCLPFAYTWTEPPLSAGDYNRTYYLGETIPISWTATFNQWPRVSLRISPAFIVGITYGTLIENATNQGGLLWKVGLNDGVNATAISTSNKFFFQLNDATGADNYTLGSPAFYIQSSSSPTSLSSTPTASTTSSQGGLDTAAKIGIGVGIPVALIAGVTATLAWICLGRRIKKKRLEARSNTDDQQHTGAIQQGQRHTMMSTGIVPSEIDGTCKAQRSELPVQG